MCLYMFLMVPVFVHFLFLYVYFVYDIDFK